MTSTPPATSTRVNSAGSRPAKYAVSMNPYSRASAKENFGDVVEFLGDTTVLQAQLRLAGLLVDDLVNHVIERDADNLRAAQRRHPPKFSGNRQFHRFHAVPRAECAVV